ncbi:hypothetical protein [Pseudomonas sp.]|uniref:hypothetical protein n=1 Tax=Pseudomonas sp. TaxID=306 RepID=UPI003FD7FE21
MNTRTIGEVRKSYMGAGIDPTAKSPEIISQIGRAEMANDRIAEALAKLADRLQSVLTPEFGKAGCCEGNEPTDRSPMAETIERIADRALGHAETIEALVDRLEL